MISIITPVYNEESVLAEFYKRTASVMKSISQDSFEIIFVNDGSNDETVNIIKELCGRDKRIKLVSFSRNFGHQIAITAGLRYSKGDAAVIIDADLQDPPELIPKMLEKWNDGYEIVYAVREKREGETFFKKITAYIFYRLLRLIAKEDLRSDSGDFRLLGRKAINVFNQLNEKSRYVRGLMHWIGFRQCQIAYHRKKRFSGRTKYTFSKMLKFALDGITSFSHLPLRLASYFGLFVSFVCFLYLIYAILLKLLTNAPIGGWTSLMTAILFIGGIQLVTIGIIGEYIGRIFDETKNRPLYIIDENLGFEEQPDK
jgi:polyisoprenyl-phosphate glycosyltransferase